MTPAYRISFVAVVLLIAAFGASSTHASTEASVPASSTVCEGRTIAIPLDIDSDGASVVAIDMDLMFDENKIAPVDVAQTGITDDCFLSWQASSNMLDIAISCASTRTIDGPVAYAHFEATGTGGMSSVLDWVSAEIDEIPVSTTSNGTVSIITSASELEMPVTTGGAGGMVDIPLSGDLAPGSLAFDVELNWDPTVLTGVSASIGAGLPADCFINTSFSIPGVALMSVACVTPLTGPTALASVQFNVIGGVGDQSPLDLVFGEVNELPACVNNGLFTAVDPVLVSIPDKSFMCEGPQAVTPITVDPADSVLAMDFVLAYDSAAVLPAQVANGALTADCDLVWNIPVAGQLAIGISCMTARTGSGVAANVVWDALVPGPVTTALTWLQHDLNEGLILSSSADGEICVTTSDSTLSVPTETNTPSGAVIMVPLTGTVPAGTFAVDATVTWDPTVLTASTVTFGPGLPGDWVINFHIATPGTANISGFGATAVSGAITFATMNLNVIGTAGDTTALNLTFGEVNEVPACLVDGVVYLCGNCDDGKDCTADTCVMGACVNAPLPSATVCRGSSGGCDPAEACDGASATCPADAVTSAGTACRASAGACDVVEICDGATALCPVNVIAAAATVCRTQAGICDVVETCDGVSLFCPADSFEAATTLCRPSTGGCDSAETCDGLSVACPSNSFSAPGTLCRSSSAGCDVGETCDGSSTGCPADSIAVAGMACRASAGACDFVETCDGTTALCPADVVAAAATLCRASAGSCDPSESCDGVSATCPVDAFAAAGTTCRVSSGNCDPEEFCDGASASCPANAISALGTECRSAVGVCDLAEICDGASVACPANSVAAAGTACRASAGDCDVSESCDGASVLCPADVLVAATECRASAGACDPSESCNGASATCPVDALAAAATTCRGSAGSCDPEEICNGVSATCPVDALVAATTTCRGSSGSCDAAESCDGASAVCPADTRVPAGVECRASAGDCDVAEVCDGVSITCPTDVFEFSGNMCSDGNMCTSPDTCDGTGTCTGGPLLMGCDGDADGVDDTVDNCDFDHNPDQSDIDMDGAGDLCDMCPADPVDDCDTGGSTAESVDTDGGMLETPDNSITMTVPAGALTEETSLSITGEGPGLELTTPLGGGEAVFTATIGPEGTVFAVPVPMVFRWDDIDSDGLVDGTSLLEDDLVIVKDGVLITDRCSLEAVGGALPDCDTAANTFTFELTSLSEFSLTSLFCSPGDPVNFPGNTEVCDLVDNDCDGKADEGGVCCGNATVEPNEDCEDGNTTNGDCCSSLCLFESAATVCRDVAGACDTAETCSGTSQTCPADSFAVSGTECRSASGSCDVAESCAGGTGTCPADGFAVLGTGCSDGLYCTDMDTCNGSGACISGPARSCDDSNGCTTDECDDTGDTCVNVPACDIEGTTLYNKVVAGPADAPDATNPIEGVAITLSGDASDTTFTASDGEFSFLDDYAGTITVTPSRAATEDDIDRALSAADASLIARAAVQLVTLTPKQIKAADVSDNGAVSSFDAALVGQRAVDIITTFANLGGATWFFEQATRTAILDSTPGESGVDFCGVIYGDVTMNWTGPATTKSGSPVDSEHADLHTTWQNIDPEKVRQMAIDPSDEATLYVAQEPRMLLDGSYTMVLGLSRSDGVLGLDLSLRYDPDSVSIESVTPMGLADGFQLDSNQRKDGTFGLSLFSPVPMQGTGDFLVVRLKVDGLLKGLPFAVEGQANEGAIKLVWLQGAPGGNSGLEGVIPIDLKP